MCYFTNLLLKKRRNMKQMILSYWLKNTITRHTMGLLIGPVWQATVKLPFDTPYVIPKLVLNPDCNWLSVLNIKAMNSSQNQHPVWQWMHQCWYQSLPALQPCYVQKTELQRTMAYGARNKVLGITSST